MDAELMSLIRQLAHYLRTHPDACDATDGIARWWLPANEPSAAVPRVEAALACLHDCGVVEATRAVDGRVRYRRTDTARHDAPTGTPDGVSGPAPSTADIDARLAALVADPRRALAPAGRATNAGGLH
jgi:hypothetical protein